MTKSREAKIILEDKISLNFSEEMIEQVFREFEADNPGQTFNAMSEDEFAKRMMAKIEARAEWVQ